METFSNTHISPSTLSLRFFYNLLSPVTVVPMHMSVGHPLEHRQPTGTTALMKTDST